MNRQKHGLLPWDPEYCDKDFEHMMKGGNDMVDYSLKDFKKWVMKRKEYFEEDVRNPITPAHKEFANIRANQFHFIYQTIFEFEKEHEQEKTPRYTLEKIVLTLFIDGYVIRDKLKPDINNQNIKAVFTDEKEARSYAEYLNKKEEDKPEISINTLPLSEQIKKNNEIIQKNMKILMDLWLKPKG